MQKVWAWALSIPNWESLGKLVCLHNRIWWITTIATLIYRHIKQIFACQMLTFSLLSCLSTRNTWCMCGFWKNMYTNVHLDVDAWNSFEKTHTIRNECKSNEMLRIEFEAWQIYWFTMKTVCRGMKAALFNLVQVSIALLRPLSLRGTNSIG